MMRVFILCCVLLGVLQVEANLSEIQKFLLDGYHKDCLHESKVGGDIIDKMLEGGFSDDPTFKNYIYCMSTRLNLFNDNGIIQKDIIKKHLNNLLEDEALLSKILEQCPVQKSSPQETSFYMAKCMREVDPNINLYKQIYLAGKEKAHELLLFHKHCAERDSLDEEVIDRALKEKIILDNPEFKNYIYCISREEGYQQKNGSIDKVAFEKGLRHVIDQSINEPVVVRELVEVCSQNQEAPEDTYFFMLRCVREYSRGYVELFPPDKAMIEEGKLFIEHGRACIEETKVDRKILEKARQGIYQEDAKFKEFRVCLAKKAGSNVNASESEIGFYLFVYLSFSKWF